MIDLTRRNFLIGSVASSLLVLLPPALKAIEVKKEIIKTPSLITASMTGVSTGEIVRETIPGSCDISLKDFTFEANTQLEDITCLGNEYRQRLMTFVDYTVEAWVRTEDLNMDYIGRQLSLSLQTEPNVFYRGNFLITSITYEWPSVIEEKKDG